MGAKPELIGTANLQGAFSPHQPTHGASVEIVAPRPPESNFKALHGGEWKPAIPRAVLQDNTWKSPKQVFVLKDGVWHPLWQSAEPPAVTKPVMKDKLAVSGSSMSFPAHEAGDLLVVFAQNAYTLASAAPTKPAAGGTVPPWNTLHASPGSEGVPVHVGWFVATQSGHTSGTWANASVMMCAIITGADPVTPIGAADGGRNPSGTSAHSPPLTLQNTTGTSMVLTYYANQSSTGSFDPPPDGYVKHSSGTKTCLNEKIDTTSYEPVSQAHTSGVLLMWRTVAFEVLPGGAVNTRDTSEAGPIKGNADSGLYHMPDSPYYSQTKAEALFATEAEAQAAGFTKYTRKPRA